MFISSALTTCDGKWLICVVVVSLYFLITKSDVENETEMKAQYCEMTSFWRFDAANGVRPERRRGWPDYKRLGRC